MSGVTSLYACNDDGARLKQTVAGAVTTYTQDLAAPLPVILQARTGSTTKQYLYFQVRYMNPTLGIFLAHDLWSGNVMQPGSVCF